MAFSVRRAMFYTASALLIVMFGLSSVMKLTPALNAATHAELVRGLCLCSPLALREREIL